MAHIDIKPQKYMVNLLHVLAPYASKEEGVLNVIVEINSNTINKYELITETGHLKLDRVGYSSLAYPFAYGAIPMTWDEDGDPLDIEIIDVTEPLAAGCVVEARIIGIMKFNDGGETDDKVIAVLAGDKRMDHVKTIADLGEQFEKETSYYWEHYKDLKKPGTCKVEGFFGVDEAKKVIDECIERYNKDYAPRFGVCDCEDGCSDCSDCSDGECDCDCNCEDDNLSGK